MTNAEKYLKDGEAGNFVQAFSCWYYGITRELENADKMLVQFLKAETKPTLTEDERVILRNLKSIHNVIGRNRDGNIQLMCKEPRIKDCIWHINLSCYNHLFQFIKERRRIRNKRIIGGKMTKKELEWIHKTKEELIEELDKAYKEIIELNKIIDKWERIYKPKTEIVNVGENVFEKDLQKITYINKYEGYHRAERRRI